MTPTPTNLTLVDPGHLVIEWSDGQRRRYDVVELRRSCPCATCNAERSKARAAGSPPPAPSAAIAIQSMKPMGNYAYGIHFSDGHDTGIYTLELLRSLGEE
jgi:DUF971 family protein